MKLLMNHEVEWIRKHNGEPYGITFHTWKLPEGRYWIFELDNMWIERDKMPEPRLLDGIQRTYCIS